MYVAYMAPSLNFSSLLCLMVGGYHMLLLSKGQHYIVAPSFKTITTAS